MLDFLKCFFVEENDQKVNKIGDDRTDQDRRDDIHRTGHQGLDGRQVVENQVSNNTGDSRNGVGTPSVA